jgi:hypothetical protein
VVDGVADQREHVLVGKSVENVLGLAPAPNQANDGQGLQSRRDGGDLLAVLSQFRHARLALGEPQQEPKPFRVTERPENFGGSFNLSPRWEKWRGTGRMSAVHPGSVLLIIRQSIEQCNDPFARRKGRARPAKKAPREASLKPLLTLDAFRLRLSLGDTI